MHAMEILRDMLAQSYIAVARSCRPITWAG